MSQPRFLKNPSSKNYIVLAPQRFDKPDDHAQTNICPFCPGNEGETKDEILRFGRGGANQPGWDLRVVPNKYPITEVHEVVILTSNHDETPFDHTSERWDLILKAYRERFNVLKEKGTVSIFHNHGYEAGESREHDHSQIVVVPKQVEVRSLPVEKAENLFHETEFFEVFNPTASSWPFESVVLPKERNKLFGDVSDEQIEDLSNIFPTLLKKLEKSQKKNFPFNFYIYHDLDWYIRLIPRLKTPAGFELATGIFVNTVDPKEAAENLSW